MAKNDVKTLPLQCN